MPAYKPSFSQKQPRTIGSSVRLRASPEYVCSGSHHLAISDNAAQMTGGATLGASAVWRRLKPLGPALTISARAPAAPNVAPNNDSVTAEIQPIATAARIL